MLKNLFIQWTILRGYLHCHTHRKRIAALVLPAIHIFILLLFKFLRRQLSFRFETYSNNN